MNWLLVLINSNQRHVDVESRKVEIVRIATKECSLKLRYKNETNVCVLFVSIQVVQPALIKRNHVRTEPCCLGRLTLNRRDLSSTRCKSVGVRSASLHRSI